MTYDEIVEKLSDSKPVRQIHYTAEVWTDEAMDGLRRERCLCLRCGVSECPAAKVLHGICIMRDLAIVVTRCPIWKEPT